MENISIEYKESWRDEYLAWLCAFANTKGGELKLGINDKGEYVGLKKSKKLLEDLPNLIRDKLGILPEIELLFVNDFEYIEIRVKKSVNAINYKGEYYIRSGSTTQALKGNALNAFLLEKMGKRWESFTVPEVDILDLDLTSIQYFKNLYEEQKNLSVKLNISPSSLMLSLNLLDHTNLNRAGVLLFHPNPSIIIPGCTVKIGYFRTDTELVFQDEVEGSIITQPQKIMDLLYTKYFEATIKYQGIKRIDKFPYPEKAIREAILNAIIHKNYDSGIPIQIKVYSYKISIFNEGSLPLDISFDKFLYEHPSRPFNPIIANVFAKAGFIESWGRGITVILEEIEKFGLPTPIFEIENGFTVKFINIVSPKNTTKLSISGSALLNSIEALSTDNTLPLTLKEIEQIKSIINELTGKSLKIIISLKSNQPLSRKEILDLIDVTNQTTNSNKFLLPLLNLAIVQPTIKERPNSKIQKYFLTTLGSKIANFLSQNQKLIT